MSEIAIKILGRGVKWWVGRVTANKQFFMDGLIDLISALKHRLWILEAICTHSLCFEQK